MSREQSSRKSSNVTFDVIIENGLNNMNGKSLDEVIMSCDKDGNGIIDYTEFKAAMLIE
jgi:Ca2+-binding EF-hand superfamily protein